MCCHPQRELFHTKKKNEENNTKTRVVGLKTVKIVYMKKKCPLVCSDGVYKTHTKKELRSSSGPKWHQLIAYAWTAPTGGGV